MKQLYRGVFGCLCVLTVCIKCGEIDNHPLDDTEDCIFGGYHKNAFLLRVMKSFKYAQGQVL